MMTSILVIAVLIALKVLWNTLTAGTARPSRQHVQSGYIVTQFAREKRGNRSEYIANQQLAGRR